MSSSSSSDTELTDAPRDITHLIDEWNVAHGNKQQADLARVCHAASNALERLRKAGLPGGKVIKVFDHIVEVEEPKRFGRVKRYSNLVEKPCVVWDINSVKLELGIDGELYVFHKIEGHLDKRGYPHYSRFIADDSDIVMAARNHYGLDFESIIRALNSIGR